MDPVMVQNVKCSFILKNCEQSIKNLSLTDLVAKKENSFYVLKSKFVYTIFYSGHVNCTKIPEPSKVSEAFFHLFHLLKLECPFSKVLKAVKIDNLVASGRISKYISPANFAIFLQEKGEKVHYNPQRFPGACLKLEKGCMLFFRSGKLVFAGLKTIQDLHHQICKISRYYNEYSGLSPLSERRSL